jgi:apolipoprotein N-acyltransferase
MKRRRSSSGARGGAAAAASATPPAGPPPPRSRRRALRLGLSLLSAVLMVLAVPSFDLWPLMWVALAPQLWVAIGSRTPRRAFLHGWLTGIAANTVAFYWMDGLLERFGHMPALEAVPIMMLLTTYQGLEFGLLSLGVYLIRGRSRLPLAVLAPLVMVTIELLVPQIFPFYLAISQAWVAPVIQIADATGPLGVTALLVAVNGALVDALARRRAGPGRWAALRPLAFAALALVADLGYGALRLRQVDARRAAAPKVKTGLVQANVGILEKWDPHEFARLLDLHQRLSSTLAGQGAELVVWPESSYPYPLPRTFAQDFAAADPRLVRRGFETSLLFGAVTLTPGAHHTRADRYPYNTAIMMDRSGAVTGTFDKVFLMLFGEYIPFYDSIPWFTKIFPEASNFNRGDTPAVFPLRLSPAAGGGAFKLGPLICYEDILPAFTRRVSALGPNALVNITNDAWFGRTAEPRQHLALAVFRTVENRLEMVRAVNTGVSAHVDAGGRVLAATDSVDPAETPDAPPATLLVDLAMLEGGGLYRHVGDLFGFLCAGALAGIWLASRRRPAPTPAAPAEAPSS